jgi:FkbM family methyltransferase
MNPEQNKLLGLLNDSAVRGVLHYLNDSRDRKVSFFQIGGNDGKRGDPVNSFCKRYSWSGIIAEPVPQYFARLEDEYQFNSGVRCVNVAVSSSEGVLGIFYVPFEDVPSERPWEQGLASLSRDHLIDNGVHEERIKVVDVPVAPSNVILSQCQCFTLNLLVVDVEGHEEVILESFPWEKYMPEVVIFESKHLGNESHGSLSDSLKTLGYSLFKLLNDTICIRKAPAFIVSYLTDLQRFSKQ